MPYLFLILTTLFWSGNFVVGRGIHSDIAPMTLAFWRWLVALMIFAPFGLGSLLRHRKILFRHRWFILIQGILGVTMFNSIVYIAVQTTTAINGVLVNSSTPVLIALCSWIFYRESMSLRQIAGILLSMGGVVFIIVRGDFTSLSTLQLNQGDLLVFLAALTWALYSTNLKRFPADLSPLAYQMAIMVVGLAFLVPFFAIDYSHGRIPLRSPAVIGSVLYVALFASVLAFIFWNYSVRRVGANRAGPFLNLIPVFSSVLAIVFLGESLYSYHILGIALIFAGIFLATVHTGSGRGGRMPVTQ